MANLWDDITKTIKQSVDTVVEKTEELTKVGKLKFDILNIRRNIEKNFAELGGKVYHLLAEEEKKQIAKDKDVNELVDCLKLLDQELQKKKVEIENVKKKESQEQAPVDAAG